MDARSYVISGRVQGVGFRWFAMRRARNLGLTGWVRNRPDGTVEAWAEGSADALDLFEAELGEGPPGAAVKDVHTETSRGTGRYRDFDVTF